MARNKSEVTWQERFEHAGETVFVQGHGLDMGSERFIKGALKNTIPNYGAAEWGLISGTVAKVSVDGNVKWKKGDSVEKMPSKYDAQTGMTTGDVLLRRMITRWFPNLADQYPDAFDEYYDEELLNGRGEPAGSNPDSAPGSAPNPTPSSAARISSGPEGES